MVTTAITGLGKPTGPYPPTTISTYTSACKSRDRLSPSPNNSPSSPFTTQSTYRLRESTNRILPSLNMPLDPPLNTEWAFLPRTSKRPPMLGPRRPSRSLSPSLPYSPQLNNDVALPGVSGGLTVPGRPRRGAISIHLQPSAYPSFSWNQPQPFQSSFNLGNKGGEEIEQVGPKDAFNGQSLLIPPFNDRPEFYYGLLASLDLPTSTPSASSAGRTSFSSASTSGSTGSYWSSPMSNDVTLASEVGCPSPYLPPSVERNTLGLYLNEVKATSGQFIGESTGDVLGLAPAATLPETQTDRISVPLQGTVPSNIGNLFEDGANFAGPHRRARSHAFLQKSPVLPRRSLCNLKTAAHQQQEGGEEHTVASNSKSSPLVRPAITHKTSRSNGLSLMSLGAPKSTPSPAQTTSALKSPGKVLAYQARVRQQRVALRDVTDELKMFLSALVERRIDTPAIKGSIAFEAISTLLSSSPQSPNEDAACETSPQYPFSHPNAFTHGAATQEFQIAGIPLAFPETSVLQHEPSSPLVASFNSFALSSSGMPATWGESDPVQGMELDRTSSLAEFFKPLATSTQSAPRLVSNNNSLASPACDAEEVRRRQKNGYKQRLRSEELAGIGFLLDIARMVSSLVAHQATSMRPNSFDSEILETVHSLLQRHRTQWDLLIAAEKRMAGPTNCASGTGSVAPSIATNNTSLEGEVDGTLLTTLFASISTS